MQAPVLRGQRVWSGGQQFDRGGEMLMRGRVCGSQLPPRDGVGSESGINVLMR